MRIDPRWRHVGMLACVWAVLFACYALTAAQDWHSPDVVAAELSARQIATTGTPWVDGQQGDDYFLSAELDPDDPAAEGRFSLFSTTNERNGHTVITRTPGAVAAGIPAYWIASLTGASTDEDLSALPGALTAAALTATAVLLLLLSVIHLVPKRLAVGATLALALATPFWSVLADALWTHSVTVLGIAGMAWASRRERWWLVGVFGGIGLWGRLHVVVIVALLGLLLAAWRRRPTIALAVAATSIPFLAAMFVWGRWLYGSWSLAAATGGYTRYEAPSDVPSAFLSSAYLGNVSGYLLSPGAGLLIWTPVLLVLVPAMVRGWSSTPDWARALAVGGIVYLLVQASLNRFHGGTGFWGNRLGLETLACLFPLGVIAASHLRPPGRRLALVAVGYQAGVVALGALFNLSLNNGDAWREYDPYLAYQDNAAATLIVLGLAMGATLLVARSLRDASEAGSGPAQLSADPAR